MLSVFMQHEPAPEVLASTTPPVPAWRYPESASNALAAAVRLSEWRRRPPTAVSGPPDGFDIEETRRIMRESVEQSCDSEKGRADQSGIWLDPESSSALLRAAGISIAAQAIADSVDEAVVAAQHIGFPVVLKAIAPGLIHRSDVQAVMVDLRDSQSLRSAAIHMFGRMSGGHSLLIQEYVDCDREVMVGISRESNFGHLIGFGLGGVDVETLGRVQFRLHPLSWADAEELVREHPGARLLDEYRGRPPGDIPSLIDALTRVSELLTVCPEISEADFNPIKVLDQSTGVCIVDARIRAQRAA